MAPQTLPHAIFFRQLIYVKVSLTIESECNAHCLMFNSSLFAVKSEIKLEERINGMDIQEDSEDKPRSRLKYPESMDEFLDRTEPQLFLMQVRFNCVQWFSG